MGMVEGMKRIKLIGFAFFYSLFYSFVVYQISKVLQAVVGINFGSWDEWLINISTALLFVRIVLSESFRKAPGYATRRSQMRSPPTAFPAEPLRSAETLAQIPTEQWTRAEAAAYPGDLELQIVVEGLEHPRGGSLPGSGESKRQTKALIDGLNCDALKKDNQAKSPKQPDAASLEKEALRRAQVLADNLNRNALKDLEEEIKSGFRDKDGNVIIRQADAE